MRGIQSADQRVWLEVERKMQSDAARLHPKKSFKRESREEECAADVIVLLITTYSV